MKIIDISIIISVNDDYCYYLSPEEAKEAYELSFSGGVSFNDGQNKQTMIDLCDEAIHHINLLKTKVIDDEE